MPKTYRRPPTSIAEERGRPDLARELHERTSGEKQTIWMDATQHIDLYDAEPYVSEAADRAADFLHRHL